MEVEVVYIHQADQWRALVELWMFAVGPFVLHWR